jgi:hypothetical protein
MAIMGTGNQCSIPRSSLRNSYYIQGQQQARKLLNSNQREVVKRNNDFPHCGKVLFGVWNGHTLNKCGSIKWRTSFVPAPAVIPTPQAYTNVAVVKTFVVNISALLYRSGQGTSVLGGFPWDWGTTPHGVVRPGLFGESMLPSGGIVACTKGCDPQLWTNQRVQSRLWVAFG